MTTDKIIKRIAERIYDRMAESGDPMPVRTHDIILAELAPLREAVKACKALPDFDLEWPDASDFVDHSNDFATAMRLARSALAKLKAIGGTDG